MNKKAIAILAVIFLLILGALGYLIYTRYGTQSTANPPGNTNNNGNNGDPLGNGNTNTPPPTQKFFLLSSDSVISPALSLSGNGVAYFDRQGNVYARDFVETNGQLTLATSTQLGYPQKPYIDKVLWPQTGDSFIVQTTVGGKKMWSYFDLQQRLYKDLPSQIFSLDWMPDGSKIAYVWLENGKATLNLSDPDSANWQEVAEMWEPDDIIHISPDGLNIAYYRESNTEAVNAINLTTPDGKVWESLVTTGYNFGVRWAPNSQALVFNKKEPTTQKYQLWYYDLLSGQEKNLGVMTTVDKVVWDPQSRFVYAAVPVTGTAGTDSFTEDTFYRIDPLDTAALKEYDPESLRVDGRDLFLNEGGSKLLFRNAQDGGLYYLDLAK